MSRLSAGGASTGPPPLRAEESLDKALGVPPLEPSDCGGGLAAGLQAVDDRAAAAADAPGSAEEKQKEDDAAAAARVRRLAGLVILDAWMRHKIVVQFARLKESLYKAEQSLTFEVLRKFNPCEAELLKEPIVQARVRFRLGGQSWPPAIYYKIFTRGMNVHYFSGSKLISAGSQAAVDSCAIMGPRLYSQGVILEKYQSQEYKISAAVDVTNHMEFVQYLSSLDAMPASAGGRNNGWRELTVTPVSKPSVLVDLFYKSHVRTPSSRHRDIQKIVAAQINGERPPRLADIATRKEHARRSKLRRMRRLYGFLDPGDAARQTTAPSRANRSPTRAAAVAAAGAADSEIDDEFGELLQWTADLSVEDLDEDHHSGHGRDVAGSATAGEKVTLSAATEG